MHRPLTIRHLDQDWEPRERPFEGAWAPWRGPATVTDRGAVWLVLDLHSGDFHAALRRPGQVVAGAPGEHHHATIVLPGDPLPAVAPYLRAPARLAVVSPAADRGQENEALEQLAPLAQQVLDGLVPIPGTGDLDWTASAMSAADQLSGGQVRRHRHRYTDAGEVFQAHADLVDPRWADLTDRQLNRAAADLVRRRVPCCDHHVGLVGVRAWLYSYRQRQAAPMLATSATSATDTDRFPGDYG